MSEPRMIPADEAKAMRELLPDDLELAEYDVFDRMAKWAPYYRTYAAAPDLAYTVERQAAQVERVREVLAWAEQAENRAHADWIRTADTHHRDAALAYTQAVTWLRYALGDNDE